MQKNQKKNAKEKKVIENKKPPVDLKKLKVVTNKKEVEMLKGQVHEESHNVTKEEKSNSIEEEIEKNNENNKKEKEEEEEIINKPKIIKPLESYLKAKLQKNFNKSLISKVNKSLDNQMQVIKLDFKNDKIKINNKKDINKMLNHISQNVDNSLTQDENYRLKNKIKMIKELKDQEKAIQNKLSVLLSNEQFLNEKESHEPLKKINHLGGGGLNQEVITFQKRLKLIENEKTKKQKGDLLYQLAQTKNKINEILSLL